MGSQIGRLRRINWELALKGEFQIGKHDYSYLVVDLQKVYQTLGHKNWPDLFVISALISLPELFLVSTKKGLKKTRIYLSFGTLAIQGKKIVAKLAVEWYPKLLHENRRVQKNIFWIQAEL